MKAATGRISVLLRLWLVQSMLCMAVGAATTDPEAIPDIPIFVDPPASADRASNQKETSGRDVSPANDTTPGSMLYLMKTVPPVGFENLSDEETTLVDVYYGNRQIMATMASFDDERIQLMNPAELVDRLPYIIAKNDVIAALSGTLDPHREFLCAEAASERCDPPRPTVAAVVFDRASYRLDIHVNPRYVARTLLSDEQFLPEPVPTLSSIHSVDALVSNDSEGRYHTLSSHSIVAYGKTRLVGQMRLDQEQDFMVDTFRFEHDRKKWTWSLGTMDNIGLVSPLLTSRGFLGIRTARTLKMRSNVRLLRSSPIFIYLEERSRVDILRDGKLLSTRFYDPGNRQLDTTTLPDGTYNITVRTRNSRGSKEERHLFTRSALIPPADHALHFLEAGSLLEVTSSSNRERLPTTTDDRILRAGSRFRIRNNIGGELELLAVTQKETTAQSGLYYFLPRFSLHGGILEGQNRSRGHYIAFNTRNRLLSLSLNHHLVKVGDIASGETAHPLLSAGRNTDMTLSANIGKDNLIVRARSTENSQDEQKTDYSLKYTHTLYHRGRSTLRMTADWKIDESDQRWLVNLEYSAKNKRFEKAFSSSWAETPDATENGLRLDARLSRSLRYGNELRGKDLLFAKSTTTGNDLAVRLERDHRLGSGFIENRVLYQDQEQTSLFTAGAHITATTSAATIALSNRKTGLAGVIVEVENSDEPFEIDIGSLTIKPRESENRKLVLLEPYREYEVSLHPRGDRLVQFDGNVRKVTLYPGNVTRLSWKVSPVFVVVGQAVSPDDTVIGNASFTNLNEFSTTDESGWFQVELASMQMLRLKTVEGRECGIDLAGKTPPPGEQVIVFDKLTCHPLEREKSAAAQ